jgi:hypothetical protein
MVKIHHLVVKIHHVCTWLSSGKNSPLSGKYSPFSGKYSPLSGKYSPLLYQLDYSPLLTQSLREVVAYFSSWIFRVPTFN